LEVLEEILEEKIDDIKNMIQQNVNNDDDIFQYNWISKFILAYNDVYVITSGLFNLLFEKIKTLLNKNFENFENYETNYIAVSFECLSSLMLFSLNKLIEIDYKFLINKIEDLILVIVNRKNNIYHLFEFTDKSMRIDITGHIINGFICMKKIHDIKNQYGGYKTYYKNKYIKSQNKKYKVIYKKIKKIIQFL